MINFKSLRHYHIENFLLSLPRFMENQPELYNVEVGGDGRKATTLTSTTRSTAGSERRLSSSLHHSIGGVKFADILLWRRWHVSFGAIIVATLAWLLLERTGLPFLTICSDILLILIIVSFLHANYVAQRNNKQPSTLPEVEVSEEMVNNAAAFFRVKINYVLLKAHDITLGKDFRIVCKGVFCLWLLSVIGSFFSSFTLAYIGTLIVMTAPALYGKYRDFIDKCCGMIHQQFSKHYRIVDECVFSRLQRNLPADRDS